MASTTKHFISLSNFTSFVNSLTSSFCAPYALKDHKGNKITDSYVACSDKITDEELAEAMKLLGTDNPSKTPVTSDELKGILNIIDNSKANTPGVA